MTLAEGDSGMNATQNRFAVGVGASRSLVATWATRGSYNFTLVGGATYNGGSCQASLSYDKGRTFITIHSYIGDCPTTSPPGGSFSFAIPSDAPTGAALFAWTWFNELGTRDVHELRISRVSGGNVTFTDPCDGPFPLRKVFPGHSGEKKFRWLTASSVDYLLSPPITGKQAVIGSSKSEPAKPN
jgi:hypothetical protein